MGKSNAEYRAEFEAKRLAGMEEQLLPSTLVDAVIAPSPLVDDLAAKRGTVTGSWREVSLDRLELLGDTITAAENERARIIARLRTPDRADVAWSRPTSWSRIGNALGLSKQAAQQKYGR